MPAPVPHLPGSITPLWNVAFDLGVSETTLRNELKAAGVAVLELSVSGKKTLFVLRPDIEKFLLSRARPVDAEPEPSPPSSKPRTLNERLSAQAREIEQLQRQVRELLEART